MTVRPPAGIVAIGEAMVEFAPAAGGLYRVGYAGDCYNTVWHLAQLLRDRARCGFFSRVGTDRLSDRFVRELVEDGLDPAAMSRDPSREMGAYLIELDGAERSFHYWRGQSAARLLADNPDMLTRAISGKSLIHVSGITLAVLEGAGRANLMTALDHARREGARISFDPNLRLRLWPSADFAREAIVEMCARTDILLPSFDDEQSLWGDAGSAATIARYTALGVGEIAVKNGAHAVEFCAEGACGSVATPQAEKLVDTTGAGDSFNAGYLAARFCGENAAGAISLGQALSAKVIATPGARADRDTVRALGAARLDRSR